MRLKRHIVTGHHHLHSFGKRYHPGHVCGAEIKLRPVSVEKWRVTSTFLFVQDVRLGLEFRVRGDRARMATTWPRSTSSRFIPRSRRPTLSPASPESSTLRNISTPVQTVLRVSLIPTISTSSFTLTRPRSTLPGHNRASARYAEHVLDRHQETACPRLAIGTGI